MYVCLFLSFRKTALRPYKFLFKDLVVRAVYKNVVIIIIITIINKKMKNPI